MINGLSMNKQGIITDLVQLGQNLKRERIKLGMSQANFSTLGYVEERTLRRYENAEKITTDRPIREFCRIANIDYTQLCKGCIYRIGRDQDGNPILIELD